MASGSDLVNNSSVSNPFILESVSNPAVGVQAYLQKLGQGSLSNPFTQFLLRDLGNQGTLDTLFSAYAPLSNGSGPQAKYDFNSALLNSFYPSANPSSSLAPGIPGPSTDYSAAVPNLADYQGVGSKIRSLLSGKDSSELGQQFGSGTLTADDVVSKIAGLIDATAPLTMDNTQKGLILNQLSDLETKYWVSGAYSTQDFQSFLQNKAADWLNIWWQTGDVKQADQAVDNSNKVTDQQRNEADQIKAQFYATQQNQGAAGNASGTPTRLGINPLTNY